MPQEATSEVVYLYKYLVHADRLVPFEEIVEKALPPQMSSAAYRAYTEEQAKLGLTIPDEFFQISANKDFVWRWWVEGILRHSTRNGRVAAERADGSTVRAMTPWEDRLYTVGPKPPYVKYQDGRLAPWTTEMDREYERANAAARVVQRAEDAIAKVAKLDRPDRDYVTKLIRDALLAIRV